MQRYDATLEYSDTGGWVTFAAAQAEIDNLETALATANERIVQLESDRIEARGIIAGLNDVISERTKPFVKIKKELADASS